MVLRPVARLVSASHSFATPMSEPRRPGRDFFAWKDGVHVRSISRHPAQRRYPPELRERAVRMVFEAMESSGESFGVITGIARQLDIGSESLRNWVRQAQVDGGQRPGHNERRGRARGSRLASQPACEAAGTLPSRRRMLNPGSRSHSGSQIRQEPCSFTRVNTWSKDCPSVITTCTDTKPRVRPLTLLIRTPVMR